MSYILYGADGDGDIGRLTFSFNNGVLSPPKGHYGKNGPNKQSAIPKWANISRVTFKCEGGSKYFYLNSIVLDTEEIRGLVTITPGVR